MSEWDKGRFTRRYNTEGQLLYFIAVRSSDLIKKRETVSRIFIVVNYSNRTAIKINVASTFKARNAKCNCFTVIDTYC